MPTKVESQTLTEAVHELCLKEACGLEDMALNLKLKGLGFDSHCWLCVELLV